MDPYFYPKFMRSLYLVLTLTPDLVFSDETVHLSQTRRSTWSEKEEGREADVSLVVLH